MKKFSCSFILKLIITFLVFSNNAYAGKISSGIKFFTNAATYADVAGFTSTAEKALKKSGEFLADTEKWASSLLRKANMVPEQELPAAEGISALRMLPEFVICPEDYIPNETETHWVQIPTESPC